METQETPKIDILMATYNGEKYIREQIESLQNQTYSNWTLLISDDGSTDNTLAIVEEMQKIDQRITIVARNAGFHSATKNFLSLLKASSAPYAMFCDQDDIWLKHKVERTLRAMQEEEQNQEEDMPVAVFSDSCVVDECLNTINPSFVAMLSFDPKVVSLSQLMVGNVVQGSTIMMNRHLIELIKKINYSELFEYHDYWVAAVAKAVGTLVYIDEKILLYRQHSSNVVGSVEKINPLQRLSSIATTFVKGGWIKKMSEDEKIFSLRARDLLHSSLSLKESVKAQLELLASVKEKNRYERIKIVKRYGLLRNKSLYMKACQLFGILLD